LENRIFKEFDTNNHHAQLQCTVSDAADELAVAEALHRFAAGIDLRDRELLTSLGQLETTHSVGNPRVTIDGDTAKLEAMVEAQHVPRNDHSRHCLMKNRYDVDLVRIDGIWVIQRTTVDNVWRTGDSTVMSGATPSKMIDRRVSARFQKDAELIPPETR
jgi:hypothetical protein